MSFLNIGSGTGYLSTLVAHILGPTGMCYGIELSREAYEHGIISVNRWKEENDSIEMPLMEFIHGNGLNIDAKTGEAAFGFDRIYVGAAIERSKLMELASMLRFGGILVGPGKYLWLIVQLLSDRLSASCSIRRRSTSSVYCTSGRRTVTSDQGTQLDE
jgi:protein-L-isoaspartate O-methyltransferase